MNEFKTIIPIGKDCWIITISCDGENILFELKNLDENIALACAIDHKEHKKLETAMKLASLYFEKDET